MTNWRIYKGTGAPHLDIEQRLPDPPTWRAFGSGDSPSSGGLSRQKRGITYKASEEEIDMVNVALYLRRPLFITGKPGVGKSSLAYNVAYELSLGNVLLWPITTRVTLKDGLYNYDAIGRLQDASLKANDGLYDYDAIGQDASLKANDSVTSSASGKVPDIGKYLRLGPLGTALLPSKKPRVLLIDEIDKSDIDLPNDLLHIFEEGEFIIPELARISEHLEMIHVMPYDGISDNDRVPIRAGRIRCDAFPFIIMTSNGEREFPPAFLRRCLRLNVEYPKKARLIEIVKEHLGHPLSTQAEKLIGDFLTLQEKGDLATDQLLNAIYFTTEAKITLGDKDTIKKALLKYLTSAEE